MRGDGDAYAISPLLSGTNDKTDDIRASVHAQLGIATNCATMLSTERQAVIKIGKGKLN